MKRVFFSIILVIILIPSELKAQIDERYALPPEWYSDYDLCFYRLDLSVSNRSSRVCGNAGMRVVVSKNGLKRLTLELTAAATVDSVMVNGHKTPYSREGDELYIGYASKKGEICDVTVYYAVSPKSKNYFFQSIDNRADYRVDIPVTWSMSEPNSAKEWFPCKQYLCDKADSAYVFITVPKGLKAGAPGILTAVTAVSDSAVRYEWKTRYPIAYYLLSFAVSDYMEYVTYAHPKGVSHPVTVQNFIYNKPDYFAKNKALLDSTATFIELFSELYVPYPFAEEKYGHCAAPMGGGMEHQTMTTLSDFSPLLVAHELSHQWFGDMVTCASFQDIWLNEGFASYSEYLALERLSTHKAALDWLKDATDAALSEPRGSVFVPKEKIDDVWRIFSIDLTYKKGATLVHMIRQKINNDALFFEVLRTYLNKYRYSTASVADFRATLEQMTAIDFGSFFTQWYYGEGYPIVEVYANQDNMRKRGARLRSITVNQKGSSPKTPLFTFDLPLKVQFANGTDTTIVLKINKESETFAIDGSEVKQIIVDPHHTLVNKVSTISIGTGAPAKPREKRTL